MSRRNEFALGACFGASIVGILFLVLKGFGVLAW